MTVLTYGFRQYPPRAQTYLHPFTGAVIATPVLDLSSVRGPAGYADKSPTGANGAPIGAPCNARGVFDEAVKLGGVNDYLNCGTPAGLDITGDISILAWANPYSNAFQALVSKAAAAANRGWALILWNDGTVAMLDSTAPAWCLATVGTPTATRRFNHVCGTKQGTIYRSFVDGLQAARVAGNAAFVASPADNCTVGFEPIPRYFTGLIELPQVWSGALSPEQVYRNYLAAKDVPIYYDTFESYPVTLVAKTVGSVCGPFRVLSNSLSVTVDVHGQHWVQGATGGVNSEGIAQWPEDDGFGVWEFDVYKDDATSNLYYMLLNSSQQSVYGAAANGYLFGAFADGSGAVMRWTAGAFAANAVSWGAGLISADTLYRFRVVRRVGGQWAVYVKGGAYPDFTMLSTPGVDNTYVGGQYHGPYLFNTDRISSIMRNRVCERPASFPWEFSTGTYAGVVSGSTIWMRCLTAGVTYLPKDLDWTSCTFGLYKGADANVTDVCFVASEIGGTTFANQNGYALRASADERLQLIRMSGGIETLLAETAPAFVAITTEYEIKIAHNGLTHAYDFLIRGGAYADWTATGLAYTLGIYTSSAYFVNDLDADDRVTAPSFGG
jgi:hypothetical protein